MQGLQPLATTVLRKLLVRFCSSRTTIAFRARDGLPPCLNPSTTMQVVGAKGTYRTRQKSIVARFVQIEYEDRYRLMKKFRYIDFVDTYSAAFRRDRFLEMGGYDTSFPVACAEDIELSYRMSARGWRMKFVPQATVYHTHPHTLWGYLKKKYKFAFWRVLAVRKNPGKAVKDSHTPQLMKVQLLLVPLLAAALIVDLLERPAISVSAVVAGLFVMSTLPFLVRALAKDPVVAWCSPTLLAARACAQFTGVLAGLINARRKAVHVAANSPVAG